MDNFEWAKESLDNLQRECITFIEKDPDSWDNATGGPPGDFLCVNGCSGNGNCSDGIREREREGERERERERERS